MRRVFSGLRVTAAAWLALFGLHAFGAAQVESASGEASTAVASGAATAVVAGQVIGSGARVITGPTGRVVLRFDDGQRVALHGSTEFAIEAFNYDQARPERSSAFFSLLKGAIRAVTGLIARSKPSSVAFRSPQATIGIRGTDFMMSTSSPLFFQVLQGSINAANAAGSIDFATGAIGTAHAATSLPVAIPASALPPSVAAAFGEMAALPLAGGLGAQSTGAPTATGVAPAVTTGTAIVIGGGAALLIGIVGSDEGTATHHGAAVHHAP